MSARSRLDAFRRLLTQVRQRLSLSFGFVLWDGASVPADLPADALAVVIADEGVVAALLKAYLRRLKSSPEGKGQLQAIRRSWSLR